jgi:Protein of unknown function (DUF3662)/FHA domain
LGILTEFERRLEGVIEGIFSKAFRTGVQPVELANRILRDMEANKTIGVHEVWVPNGFVFTLSPVDRERLGHIEKSLRKELEQVVREGAEERGWALVGPPQVQFETDSNLKEGEFVSEPVLVEGPTTSGRAPIVIQPNAGKPMGEAPGAGSKAGSGDAAAELLLIEDGQPARSFPLGTDRVIIGRLAESDVVVSDPAASRRHAEIRRKDGQYMISDLGSTNGTKVNEVAIGERSLEEGDRITIGRTVLEFRRR